MYEDSHRPLLPQGLSLNLAVGINVTVLDFDRFAGQADNPLDHQVLSSARSMKRYDFPAPWPPKLKGGTVDQDPIAREDSWRRRRSEFSPTIWADRPWRVVTTLGVAGKRELAVGTPRIDVAAQQGGCHRPPLHHTENREPLDKPRAKNDRSRQKQDNPFDQAANTAANQGLDHGRLSGRQRADSLIVSICMLDFTSPHDLARGAETETVPCGCPQGLSRQRPHVWPFDSTSAGWEGMPGTARSRRLWIHVK